MFDRKAITDYMGKFYAGSLSFDAGACMARASHLEASSK